MPEVLHLPPVQDAVAIAVIGHAVRHQPVGKRLRRADAVRCGRCYGVADVLRVSDCRIRFGVEANARAGRRPRASHRQFDHRPANPLPHQTVNPAPRKPFSPAVAATMRDAPGCPYTQASVLTCAVPELSIMSCCFCVPRQDLHPQACRRWKDAHSNSLFCRAGRLAVRRWGLN
jgi:hypothetical protein